MRDSVQGGKQVRKTSDVHLWPKHICAHGNTHTHKGGAGREILAFFVLIFQVPLLTSSTEALLPGALGAEGRWESPHHPMVGQSVLTHECLWRWQ